MSLSSSDLVVDAQKNVAEVVSEQEKKTSEELKTPLQTQRESFSRNHPTLPVEVIERILKYTFLRPSRLTPSSDPFPLVGTSHLLLVSKGFRELCLPIFFQSITISRPSHWITFFDPEHGIFAGEEGRKRWSFVKEVAVVFGVEPPIPHPPQEPNVYVVPLEVTSRQTPLDAVCFLEGEGSVRDSGPSLEDSERVLNILNFFLDFSQSEFNALPEAEQRQECYKYEDTVDDAFLEMEEQRMLFLVDELLGNGRPREFRTSLDAVQSFRSENARSSQGAYGALHVFPSSRSSATRPPGSLPLAVRTTQCCFGFTSRVHLEGFDVAFLRKLSEWLEKSGKDYGASRVTWSWHLEDGSHVVVAAAAADQEAN